MQSWLCASALLFATAGIVRVQSAWTKAEAQIQRHNETTLAGLRPGQSTLGQAQKLYPLGDSAVRIGTSRLTDPCSHLMLALDTGAGRVIQDVHVELNESISGTCETNRGPQWATGRGLHAGDPAERAVSLYGEPNSRSPSTKNGQPLELMYYAFDWAGPDVPQVMEVVCTAPKHGTRGRVMEITLAAGSL